MIRLLMLFSRTIVALPMALLLFVPLLAACASASTPSPLSTMSTAPSRFVTTDGVHLRQNGVVLHLSGYTFYPASDGGTAAWRSTAFTTFIDQTITTGLKAGQNLARPTDYWDRTNASQTMTDPTIWSNMNYLLADASAHHVYVLMDLSAYKWLLISENKDPFDANNWTTFLQWVGARYKGNTDIVAYSIVGEPTTPASQAQADQLVAFYRQVTDTLYAADSNHLIIAGGFNHMETGTQYQWWQRIYSLPHNDVAGFKTYSQHDLNYMPTIAAYAHSINKPLINEEFGAPQSLGDATWNGVPWNGFSASRSKYFEDVYQEGDHLYVACSIFWNLADVVGPTHYDVSPLTPATWAVVTAHAKMTAQ